MLYETGAEEPLASAGDKDEFSGLKTRQLREAMQRRGIPRSSYEDGEIDDDGDEDVMEDDDGSA